jgi:sugar phosphate isomerase/epimerase
LAWEQAEEEDRDVHPRVSVNSCVVAEEPLAADLALWSALSPSNITFSSKKLNAAGWDEGVSEVAALGYPVASIVHANVFTLAQPERWEEQRALLRRTIDTARTLRARSVYITTGSAMGLPWEEAARAFVEAITPVVHDARAAGVALLCETTNPLHSDISMLYTLPALIEMAEASGMGVCIDLFPSWNEAHLDRSLTKAASLAGLVQVCDVVIGDKGLDSRAVPGDGNVPIEHILATLLDMEIRGPRIQAEGPLEAVRRAGDWLSEALVRLGA